MGPEALAQVLRPLADLFPPGDHPDLLLGLAAPDDAAVYRLDDDRAVVLSSDFFPPVVDDPRAFGAIAAANALSDLYAVGATPLLAINLVGFPDDLDRGILSEILRGGAEKTREAGAVIAGGHTVSDAEPKYGLAVVGTVHPKRILTKAGARVGDVVLLTKPLGSGVVTTAARNDAATSADLAAAVESMARLHRCAVEALDALYLAVRAATDVTGFSLAGHAHEVASSSGLALRLEWEALPWLPGAHGYAAAGHISGGGRRNREHFGKQVDERRPLTDAERDLLFDPQTSGGLLLCVDPARSSEVLEALAEAGEPVWRIGEVVAGAAGRIEII